MPKQFSEEAIRSDGGRTIAYLDGWKQRLEEWNATGPFRIVICRPDKGVIWSLDPGTKTYTRTKFPKNFGRLLKAATLLEGIDWIIDGAEIVDGRRCRRFLGRYRNSDGPAGKAHQICLVDAKTGMRRRMVTFDKNGKKALTVDCVNAVVGPPPRKLFDMPEGYKRAYHRRR
jgi:outer membrane lipoprotein-sorting protein